MVETLLVRDLPAKFAGTYEAKGVFNRVEAEFEAIGDDKTRWIQHQEFQMSGAMKLMGWFMPGAFKKQTMEYLRNFKAFAERS